MVTDEMVDKAADEMARQDIMFANCDRGWQKRTIRAALEAALSATEPAGFTLEMKTSLSSNWFRDFSFEPLKENDFVRNVRPVYAAPPAPPVAVKALEWSDKLKRGDREGFVCSSSGVLSYSIMISRFRVYGIPGEHDGAAEFTSLAEAKAAAQADYEARIRSALSAQVQDVAGWEERERNARATALEEAAAIVDAVSHEGLHKSMWRRRFERVAAAIRALQSEER